MKSKILIALVGALPFLVVYGEDWAAQCGVPYDVVCIVGSIVLIGGCVLSGWLWQKYVSKDDENVPHKVANGRPSQSGDDERISTEMFARLTFCV